MIDLDLRPERRTALVGAISAALTDACEGSTVESRGSLAAGTADQYSDMDLRWIVPDDRFAAAVEVAPGVLSEIAPIASTRSEPRFQRSAKRRLLFIRFDALPLFWRLDLEVWAESARSVADYDEDNLDARGDDWSLAASATANALGAVKAVARGRMEEARGLIERGFARIGLQWNEETDVRRAITALACAAAEQDEAVVPFAPEVRSLAEAVLGRP